jgi:hypothetical protein
MVRGGTGCCLSAAAATRPFPAGLPACLPARLPACLPACLPAYLPACLQLLGSHKAAPAQRSGQTAQQPTTTTTHHHHRLPARPQARTYSGWRTSGTWRRAGTRRRRTTGAPAASAQRSRRARSPAAPARPSGGAAGQGPGAVRMRGAGHWAGSWCSAACMLCCTKLQLRSPLQVPFRHLVPLCQAALVRQADGGRGRRWAASAWPARHQLLLLPLQPPCSQLVAMDAAEHPAATSLPHRHAQQAHDAGGLGPPGAAPLAQGQRHGVAPVAQLQRQAGRRRAVLARHQVGGPAAAQARTPSA